MITIPNVIERFAAYYEKHEAWGSLHIVLEDNNVQDSSVEHCIEWAKEKGDTEGEELGRILLLMSKSQRGRLHRKVEEYRNELSKHGEIGTDC